MGNKIDEYLKIDVEQDCLNIESKLLEKIAQYEIDMINNNQVLGLIPVEVNQFNECITLFYNLNSKMQLKNALSNRKISQGEFITILRNIVKIIEDCKIYFLDEKKILFNIEHVYIGNSDSSIYMVYIPTETTLQVNVVSELKELLKNILKIFDTVKNKSKDNENLIVKVLEYLNKEDFNFNDLNNFLEGFNLDNRPINFEVQADFIKK